MRHAARMILPVLAAFAPVRAARSQDSTAEAFLAAARAASAKYEHLEMAISDGYRAMGPETPGMGQHWVNTALVLRGRIDPAAPQILEYVTVNGAPRLVGVAFALPLTGSTMAPDWPVPGSWWHAHSGGLEEESAGDSHAGMGNGAGDRVAVLHAWIWAPNPAGVFEAQNWALPFIRRGLTPPIDAASDAANAVALADDRAFYLSRFRILLHPDSAGDRALARLIGDESDSLNRLLAARTGPKLDPAELDRLASGWRALSVAIAARSAGRLRAP